MLSTAGFSVKLPFSFQTGIHARERKQPGRSYLINFSNSFSNKSSHHILVTKHKEAINSPGLRKKKNTSKKANFPGSLPSQKLPGLREEGV